MQTAYLESVVNRQHRVLGRDLHDLCLYDVQALTLLENPLWFRHREPTLADLEEAVLICSLPPEHFLRAQMAPRNFLEQITRFVWQCRCARRNFAAELAAFRTYIADYDSPPELWDPGTSGRSIRAPWAFSLACFVEMYSNMTEREIMSAPYGYIQWKAETIAERQGLSLADIMSDDEIAISAEQQAAMEASGETIAEDEAG